MSRFFTPATRDEQKRSYGLLLIDVFEALFGDRPNIEYVPRERRIDPEHASMFIRDATSYLEASWYELAGRYIELKLRYLDQ